MQTVPAPFQDSDQIYCAFSSTAFDCTERNSQGLHNDNEHDPIQTKTRPSAPLYSIRSAAAAEQKRI